MKEGEKVRERWGRRAIEAREGRGRSKRERLAEKERKKRKPGLVLQGWVLLVAERAISPSRVFPGSN